MRQVDLEDVRDKVRKGELGYRETVERIVSRKSYGMVVGGWMGREDDGGEDRSGGSRSIW